MADLEFYYDAGCPWAWITSRWVVDVQQARSLEVVWKPISLKKLNEHQTADWYTPEYRSGHFAGLQVHRVADAASAEFGNDAVGRLYTATGAALHPGGRRLDVVADAQGFMAEMLGAAGLLAELAAHVDDESHDAAIYASTEEALGRTGRDVGTPILVFHPGQSDEGSFFGPVMSMIPRGDHALRLWDAIEVIATTTGMAELKRSLRSRPSFD